MRVTVAVCTWNRAELLRGTLMSLQALQIPDGIEWTVLVVDNGSTDMTAAISGSFEEVLPITVVHEDEPGLSHARNRAVREAEGDYVLWIDDDVFVDPSWLSEYVEAFRRWGDAAVFGGPIRPVLEGSPPVWLVESLSQVGSAYSGRDLGDQAGELGPSVDRLPFGANFGIRMEEQRRFSYPTDRGRRKGSLGLGGEEILVIQGILATGKKGRWVPRAGVRHRIGPDRQTKGYLRRYAFFDGMSEEYRKGRAQTSSWAIEFGGLLRRASENEFRYQLRRWTGPSHEWIEDLLSAGDAWGRFVAHLQKRETDST